MRNSVFVQGNYAIWLGAQVKNKTFTGWTNGEPNDFNPVAAAPEYNEDGMSCLNANWGSIANDNWYNYYCDWNDYNVACQRPADWVINGL